MMECLRQGELPEHNIALLEGGRPYSKYGILASFFTQQLQISAGREASCGQKIESQSKIDDGACSHMAQQRITTMS